MNPVTRKERLLDGEDMEPITREEIFIKRLYDKTIPIPVVDGKEFLTREEYFLNEAGKKTIPVGDLTIEELDVTENGTYSEQGKAYSPVVVEVPQPTMSKLTATSNGDYTAPSGSAYNEVEVAVPLPQNAYIKKTASTYPISPSLLPLPKAEVTFSGDKAELYVSNDGVVNTDNSPYLYRQSSGENVALDIVGGTIAWNQLVKKGDFSTDLQYWNRYQSTATEQDGGAYIEGEGAYPGIYTDAGYLVNYVQGHKYLYLIQAKGTNGNEYLGINNSNGLNNNFATLSTSKNTYGKITTATNSGNYSLTIFTQSASDKYYLYKVMCIDLTQAFGSTIADYIYTLEQATAGSGIAWLKSYGYLTKDYYAYQSGKLESVNVSSRKVYDSNDTLIATYPFDSSKILRGIPKLSNGQMYYDGDVYNSDGTITRNYEERAYQSGDESLANAITDGTTTVVKKSTPTTESATPFTNPQIVGSTEEFVDAGSRDVEIPVGNVSKYVNGDIYISYGTSPIDLATEHGIMPYATTYISSNGTEDVEYWEEVVYETE